MGQLSRVLFSLARACFYSLLSFFLIPGLTYGFTSYVLEKMDSGYRVQVERKLESVLPQQREGLKSNSELYLTSKRCDLQAATRQKLCENFTPLWHFHTVQAAAWWTLAAGAAVFAAVFLLAGLAFASSRAPALSFLAGWRLLVAAATLQVIVQGGFAVWLSYWLSAYFFKIYAVKIILIVGAAAVTAAVYAVIWMFKKVHSKNEIAGELLKEKEEPQLWSRVRALAARVGTKPPDHIVAGIDANFFVTQLPLILSGREISGRILFVSLPLLRIFNEGEADAVLAHELAHFRGGDTKWTSLLGPKLRQFDLYCLVMRLRKVFVAVYILRLYRLLFEFALKRGSRRREFIADSAAASIVSGQALVTSLIKFTGYSSYRKQVESQLFAHDRRYEGALSIAQQVSNGLFPLCYVHQFCK